jgi:hypothetical protein
LVSPPCTHSSNAAPSRCSSDPRLSSEPVACTRRLGSPQDIFPLFGGTGLMYAGSMRPGRLVISAVPTLLLVIATIAVLSCGDGRDDRETEHCSPSMQFSSCIAAGTQEQCVAAGGSWGIGGFGDHFHCFCETAQGKCACRSSDECLGDCVADDSTLEGEACAAVTVGHCTSLAPSFGCVCTLFAPGVDRPGVLCTD